MKMKKRIILVGGVAAGKTTFCQHISEADLIYHKTQTIQIENGNMIDTPGEYLEMTNMRGALIVAAADADVIVLVIDPTRGGTMFPPGYTSSFIKPAIGIVTKSDIATDKEIDEAKNYLKAAGAEKVFVTSSVEGTGFEDFLDYIDKI